MPEIVLCFALMLALKGECRAKHILGMGIAFMPE